MRDLDVLFELGGSGGLDSCNIYLSDGDKTTAENDYTLQYTANSMSCGGAWRLFQACDHDESFSVSAQCALKASGRKLGFLIDFNSQLLRDGIKRFVN